MIQIVIFDDTDGSHGEAITRKVPVPTPVLVKGASESVEWHGEWNGLGDAFASSLSLSSVAIRDPEQFDRALTWCLQFTGRAICFCDYQLNGVEVTREHIDRVGAPALAIAETLNVPSAVGFFNSDNQGLLLAAALAANNRADADIWLATSVSVKVKAHAEILNKRRGRSVFVDVALDSYGRTFTEQRAVAAVITAVDRYAARRALHDPGFWPVEADDWFATNRRKPSAPHNHGSFSESAEREGKPLNLFTYLFGLGATEAVARNWLHQHGCYESLKHFLGACAVAHSSRGTRQLTVASLLFPLLNAAQGTLWVDAEALQWDVNSGAICAEDQAASRRLILTALKLFESLLKPHEAGASSNSARARFEAKDDGAHLLIDFSFDCSVGDAVHKPSFAAKCLTFKFRSPNSDSSRALYDLLEESNGADQTSRLFVAVYPVQHGAVTWTRLDFKASV